MVNTSSNSVAAADSSARDHAHDLLTSANTFPALLSAPNSSSSRSPDSNFVIRRSTSSATQDDSEVPQAELHGAAVNVAPNAGHSSDATTLEDKVMAVYWRAGKLGAAYFDIETAELFVLDEIVDRPPEHSMLCNLYRQVAPRLVLTDGRISATFVAVLKRVTQNGSPDSDNGQCKLTFLNAKEYNFEACKRRIQSLSLAREPRDCTPEQRLLFLRTALNFAHAQSVHALGALLTYLDCNWSNLTLHTHTKPQYIALRTISLADIVTIDEETYKALQIFNVISHPSNFKRGTQGSSREGLSLFSLFNKCSSKVGASLMRVLMQHPTQNVIELNRRQDAIAFCIDPRNDMIVKNVSSSLRFINNVTGIMAKIKSLSARPYEWKSLYNTLYHTVLICEMCENGTGSALVEELGSSENNNLYEVAIYMNQIIDFDMSKVQGKFTVKTGIDPELDQKKQVMASLHGLMSTTAKCELEKLPDFIEECTMVYIPHLGYLLGVKSWAEHLTPKQKELPNLKFMNHDYIHYKSKGCEELDFMIGDTYPEIMAHETRIMMKLTTEVMQNLETLSSLIGKCAELDCMIAMSKVCRDLNFVRPVMTKEKVIKIKEGKHPLHMICTENLVPNDTSSTAEEGFVKVLTGPTSSGKSVYLKQVALLAYLAHVGSFVPAARAELGVLSHISTRIQSLECVASQMSAFLIDLRQMSLAIQESSGNSLVIIDEFGKGTSEVDGLALLSACINTFLFQENDCPHIFISTHFLNIKDYILNTPLVKFQHLEYIVHDEELVFLFRVIDGSVESSLAHEVAKMTGIEDHIVSRAKNVMTCMLRGDLPPENKMITSRTKSCTKMTIRELLSKVV